MGEFKDYRTGSRTNWGTTSGEPLTIEQINIGCMLRIADATEKMAVNYQRLIDERNQYENWWKQARDRENRLQKQLSAMKGVVTKLRKKNVQQ